VTSFLDFVSRLNLMHEDVLVRLFVYSLEGDLKASIKFVVGRGKYLLLLV
jgi:hypothetical protein